METNTLLKKYVHRPTEVEAFQHDGTEDTAKKLAELSDCLEVRLYEDGVFCGLYCKLGVCDDYVSEGDYVVNDLHDNYFYVLPSDEFEAEFIKAQ